MDFLTIEHKRILISPLNWGLGHATRLIPVIEKLCVKNEIYLAGNQPSISILTQRFPNLKAHILNEHNFSFSSNFFNLFQLIRFIRFLGKTINEDLLSAKKIVETYNIDMIISDNRYGFRTIKTENIIISHQLFLKLPKRWHWAEKMVHRKVFYLLKKFNHVLIPDFESEENLSGDLSHKYPLPKQAEFIGPLSRFEHNTISNHIEPDSKKILVILSGPEPQRTNFEKKLETIFLQNQIPATFLLGAPHRQPENNQHITKIPHINDEQFIHLLKTHKLVISRAGYSTIMDFYYLNRNVILVPTPEQTEQIYLAKHLIKYSIFRFVPEENIHSFI